MVGVFSLLLINGMVSSLTEPDFKDFREMPQQVQNFNGNEPKMPEPPSDFPKFGPGHDRERPFMFTYIVPAILPLLLIVLGAVIKMYSEWRTTEETKKEIAAKKISSELQFLKAQLNPHFLFNSLNTIYSLSVKQSNETSEAVINLSEMMRYMIYEADKDVVSLEKELHYVQHYIYLQRLRLVNSEAVTLNVHGDYRNNKIQPLLFVSFIENAFKYGTDFTGKTIVKIVIDIKDDGLSFFCQNIIGKKTVDKKNSGIGLENIKSRLNLLYPNTHKLTITTEENLYTVDLYLKFKSS
ncbi:sensor histidine kinase [Pustulibacterium marinum]|uniref:sensor histidine kinase n=1 Tax=Pustulibacterium marinum TaxID=1224947 RepID=UPI001C4304E1|nr:sensor histidine kinase [Pustulibacterium marinum]